MGCDETATLIEGLAGSVIILKCDVHCPDGDHFDAHFQLYWKEPLCKVPAELTPVLEG